MSTRGTVLAVTVLMAVGAVAGGTGPRDAASAPSQTMTVGAPELVELYSYYSGSTDDWALSSDAGFSPPGYALQGSEGRLFSPDQPQPPSTVPLYTWFSASRADYFTTSNPVWAGSPGTTQDGYTFVGVEGYAHALPVAGTRRLELWWSGASTDNRTTTAPALTASAGAADGYYRASVEGYVLPPGSPQVPEVPATFHSGTMGGGPRGARDLLVLMVNWTGAPFRHTREQYRDLFFGPDLSGRTISGYFYEVSLGAFRWRSAGVEGPFTPRDDPDTTGDESAWRDVWDSSWEGLLYLGLKTRNGRLVRAVNGGGSAADAAGWNLLGWETLALVDLNGGELMSGDAVAFKTLTGHFLGNNGGALSAGYTNKGITACRFDLTRVAGFGQVKDGDAVTLKSELTGQYVVAVGGGGAAVVVNTVEPGDDGVFTVVKGAADADRQTRVGISQAVASGFDFARYDTDGNGLITEEELTMLVVGSGPSVSDGARNRPIGRYAIPDTPLSIEARDMPDMGEGASFSSAAHELSHSLGTIDLYGETGLNGLLTVMSYTIFVFENDRRVFHLDPWHKVRLGWVEPRIRALRQAGESDVLLATSYGESEPHPKKRPLLLYDPSRYDLAARSGEFFLVELRARQAGLYDRDVWSSGVRISLCLHDGQGNLPDIPSLVRKDKVDKSCNTFGPPDGVRGGPDRWSSSYEAIQLRWFDGTAADVLRIGYRDLDDLASLGVEVEWSPTGLLRPRIDSGSQFGFPGGWLRLDGVFPVGQTQLAVLLTPTGGGPLQAATITQRTSSRLTARLTGAIPLGGYTVTVNNEGKASNGWPFQVIAYAPRDPRPRRLGR